METDAGLAPRELVGKKNSYDVQEDLSGEVGDDDRSPCGREDEGIDRSLRGDSPIVTQTPDREWPRQVVRGGGRTRRQKFGTN